ncbi:MAG TPA: hypothetical protein VGC11_03200 [Acidimicrobiia bacterium]
MATFLVLGPPTAADSSELTRSDLSRLQEVPTADAATATAD